MTPKVSASSAGPHPARDAGLDELEAGARYARERYQLYRAKSYGPRITDPGRLRLLGRRAKLAQSQVDRARAVHGADA